MDINDIFNALQREKFRPNSEEMEFIEKLESLNILNKNKDKKGNFNYKFNKNAEVKEIDMYKYKISVHPEIKYAGLFFNKESEILDCRSDNKSPSDNYHCTFAMSPKDDYVKGLALGRSYKVGIESRGYDEENEGLKIKLPEQLDTIYKNKNIPHITLGISRNGKPFKTGKLDFNKKENGELVGTMGVYTDLGTFYNHDNLRDAKKVVKIQQKAEKIKINVDSDEVVEFNNMVRRG